MIKQRLTFKVGAQQKIRRLLATIYIVSALVELNLYLAFWWKADLSDEEALKKLLTWIFGSA